MHLNGWQLTCKQRQSDKGKYALIVGNWVLRRDRFIVSEEPLVESGGRDKSVPAEYLITNDQREKKEKTLLSLDETARQAPKKSWNFMINFTRWQDPLAYSEALSQLLRELKTVPTAPHQQ